MSADEDRVLREFANELGGAFEEAVGFVVDRSEDGALFLWERLARSGAIPRGAWRLAPMGGWLCTMARALPPRGGRVVGAVSYLSMRTGLRAARGLRRSFAAWR